jgi:hypothetical protein
MVVPTSEPDSSAHAVCSPLVEVAEVVEVVEVAPVDSVVVLDPDDPAVELEQEASARLTISVRTRAARSAHVR